SGASSLAAPDRRRRWAVCQARGGRPPGVSGAMSSWSLMVRGRDGWRLRSVAVCAGVAGHDSRLRHAPSLTLPARGGGRKEVAPPCSALFALRSVLLPPRAGGRREATRTFLLLPPRAGKGRDGGAPTAR